MPDHYQCEPDHAVVRPLNDTAALELIRSGRPVLIYLWAQLEAPDVVATARALEASAGGALSGRVVVGAIDVDRQSRVAATYGVGRTDLPAYLAFNGGPALRGRQDRPLTSAELDAWIRSLGL